MVIENIKINGLYEPMGYRFDRVTVSWQVEKAAGRRQDHVLVRIRSGERVVAEKSGSELSCGGVSFDCPLRPRTRYTVEVSVTDETGDSAVGTSWFETGKMGEPWTGRWIGPAEGDDFHPVLVKDFPAQGAGEGRVYLCGLGVYEAYLNGEKIGDDCLAPFVSDYHHEIQYQTYDISPLLKEENRLEVYLGDGWYKGAFGIQGQKAYFGDRYALIAEVWLDGRLAVCTDESWQYRGSDISFSGIYDGEGLDRLLWSGKENSLRPVERVEIAAPLVERLSLPLRVVDRLAVKEVIHTPAGETVLDFGQNHAGWIEMRVRQSAGTEIVLECGEILQQGNFYRDNYRDAKSRFVYRSDGREETVRQHFTFYGFRYVRVTGWVGDVKAEDFTALVLCSDLERTGRLEIGNTKVDRLYRNVIWGQLSNFLDMPTDCPQRNERLGWTGDAQVFAPTASYNMDTRAFYRKFLHDLRGEQLHYGKGGVPSYFPSMGDFSVSSIWGDAAAFIPNTLAAFYDDPALMEECYPLMKDWVDYVETQSHNGLFDTGFTFGDWLAQDGLTPQSFKGGTDDVFLSSAYACESARIVSVFARYLGIAEDAEHYGMLSGTIRKAVIENYFTPTGRLSVDTQAAYIVALKFDLCEHRDVVLEQFRRRLQYDHYQIRCGFVGAPLICTVLAENGMTDMAYELLLGEECPGWLYAVNLGATTIWERWNSMLEDGTCSGTGMNSFNHYSYGSVAEFLYGYAAGIRRSEKGFRHAIIAPEPNARLGYVKGSYRSNVGEYACRWKICPDGRFKMSVEVPFNCTAEITLPRSGKAPFTVEAGRYEYDYVPEEDFRSLYGWNSRLGQLAGDEDAVQALLEYTPQLAGVLRDGGEMTYLTFAQLQHNFFMGLNPDNVGKTVEKLKKMMSQGV